MTHDKPAYVNQAQDALKDQIVRVLSLATQHGEYDAADWISRAFFGENTDDATYDDWLAGQGIDPDSGES